MSTPQYILDFITAVCPEAPDLYMASFNERACLVDATKLIAELRQRVATVQAEREQYKEQRDNAWAVINQSISNDGDTGTPIGEQWKSLLAERDAARAALGRAVDVLNSWQVKADCWCAICDEVQAILADPQGQQAAQEWQRLTAVAEAARAKVFEAGDCFVCGGDWDAHEQETLHEKGCPLVALQPSPTTK